MPNLPDANRIVLRAFYDAAASLMGVVQIEGDLIRHLSDNRAAADFFGVPPGSTQGKLATELGVSREMLNLWLQYYRQAEKTRRPQTFEHVNERQGRPHIFETTVTFLEKTPEGYSKCCYVVNDITERKESEERIFSATFDHAAVGLAHVALDGTFRRMNRRLCEIVGYAPTDLARMRFTDITHPADRESSLRLVRETLDGKISSFALEKRYLHKSGRTIWGSITGSLLKKADGTSDHFIVSVEDITLRKEIELRLASSEARLRRIFDSGIVGIIYWNTAGQITDANDKFLEMLGYTREDLQNGRINWAAMTPPEFAAQDEYALQELRTTGIDTPYEKAYLRKDGSRLPIIIGAAMLDDTFGDGVAFVLDVSARKDADEALRRSAAQLQDALRIRDEFMSIASHELKTPLTALKLQHELLRRLLQKAADPFPLDRLRLLSSDANRQVDRLTRLVDDLLDISRIQTGRLTFRFETVKVAEIVEDVVDRNRPQLTQALCTVELHLERGLMARWDRMRLEQIVWNFLSNAIKYAPGSVVQIRAYQSGPNARIEIQDQGPGIPKELHTQIFERFERGVSGTGISGLGLGLFIVKSVAEGHGGHAWVESQLDHGSVFIVELPLNPPDAGESDRAETESA